MDCRVESLFPVLSALKESLENIDGIETLSIGIEANIAAERYPIIRIVPVATELAESGAPGNKQVEVVIYFGRIAETPEGYLDSMDGLSSQWEWLFDMEREIYNAIIAGSGFMAEFVETVFDEDRLPGYKLAASRFSILSH